MKYIFLIWVLFCVISSYIYSLFFIETLSNPAFALSSQDHYLIIFILSLLSLIITFPLTIIVKKISKSKISNNDKVIKANLIVFISVLIVLFLSSWIMVSVIEGLELILSYGILAFILLNTYLWSNRINNR
jgi:uncharacterized membrane protein YhaH (DUF805 family)